MKVDIYATSKTIGDKQFCKLLVKSGFNISDLSKETIRAMGILKFIKTIDISPKDTIIGLNCAKAIEGITENGFFVYCQIS